VTVCKVLLLGPLNGNMILVVRYGQGGCPLLSFLTVSPQRWHHSARHKPPTNMSILSTALLEAMQTGLESTEAHRGGPVRVTSVWSLPVAYAYFYMARRLATLAGLTQRPVSLFVRATSIKTSPWHPSRKTTPQRRPNLSTNSRSTHSTVALPLE
jgi:hypothetical protein